MSAERWQQVKEVLADALKQEPAVRAAYLDRVCSEPSVRRQVESLIAAYEQGDGSFLTQPAVGKGALNRGTELGSYEIVAPLGGGGMGEVYQAYDTKLRREVAIKVLPAGFIDDPYRLSRFRREARMLAALNHPNIATIYGLEQSNGTNYLVMELVHGQTLANRIERNGATPVEEALAICRQIAEALEAAHEKGIIHRDLKPANVKVTPEGKVKVLDFGLAKAFTGDTANDGPSNSQTLNSAATMHGVILGTAAYMSPEQACSKSVDKRTDIWAFGCVLFELLTGKQAFQGEDVTEILSAVVRAEPNWQLLLPGTSAQVRSLLGRCLQKDRTLRVHDAGDLRIEIVEALGEPKGTGTTRARSASRSRLSWVIAAVFAVAALVSGALLWHLSRLVAAPPQRLVRLDVDLGPDVSLGSNLGPGAILSPDGARLVYVSRGQLFTRRLDQPATTELAGTTGAYAPFFSPDGRWVAFFAGGRLKKVSVEGGAVIDLCAAPNGRGGSWGGNGDIVAVLSNTGGLSRIPSAGGVPAPVSELAQGEGTHRWPQILPGGTAVLFTTSGSVARFDGANVEVMSLADHRRKTLQRGGTFGRYLPSGHLVYVSRGTLFAVPFDLKKLQVRGTPTPVLSDVSYSITSGSAQFDYSENGTVVYRTGTAGGGMVTVQWRDGAGNTKPLLAKPGVYARPRLSPDGQRLGLLVGDGSNQDLWSYEWRRDMITRLTFGGTGANPTSVWTPDGHYIAFQSVGGISWTRTDGPGQPQPMTQSENLQNPYSFAPDGKRLAYIELHPGTGVYDLWTVPVEIGNAGLRAGKPEVFLQTKFDQRQPSFSPDGRWMAYASNESGSYEVYVRTFPDNGRRWEISNSGGFSPTWSRNGHELFFRTEDSKMILVAAYTVKGDSFLADKPRVWSDKPLADTNLTPNYDLAPDGKRIAVVLPVETPQELQAQNHVVFLENFFDELRRRAPLSGK